MGNLIADLVDGVGGGSVRDTRAAGPARSGTYVCFDIPLVNHFRQYHALVFELTLEDELTADGFVESQCRRRVAEGVYGFVPGLWLSRHLDHAGDATGVVEVVGEVESGAEHLGGDDGRKEADGGEIVGDGSLCEVAEDTSLDLGNGAIFDDAVMDGTVEFETGDAPRCDLF